MTLAKRLALYARDPATILISVQSVLFRVRKLGPILRRLRPGDVAIDCGANVGDYSAMFAKRGATVYAFEPHPAAFDHLRRRFAGREGVVCFNKAVAATPAIVRLYLHGNDAADPVLHSQSASLLSEKQNVDPVHSIEVEAVSLAAFIRGLGKPVALLKIDVEGAEYDLLDSLLDEGVVRDIRTVVVETHPTIPGLRARHDALIRRVKDQRLTNIDLGWR